MLQAGMYCRRAFVIHIVIKYVFCAHHFFFMDVTVNMEYCILLFVAAECSTNRVYIYIHIYVIRFQKENLVIFDEDAESKYLLIVNFKKLVFIYVIFLSHIYLSIYIRGSVNKFPDFFRMGTFIDSTHMKLSFPSKQSPPAAMNLLYRSNTFWKAPLKSSCVSVSMTFVTTSFISSIVS